MHILFVARESFPQHMMGQAGGIGRYAQTMSQGLVAQGAKVTVLSQSHDNKLKIENINDVQVIYIPKWEHSSSLSWRLNQIEGVFLKSKVGQELWSDLSGKIRRALLVNRYIPYIQNKLMCKFDIVEFPECGAEGLFYLSRKTRLPSVVRIHCPTQLLLEMNHNYVSTGKRLLVRAERFASRRADVVTSPSISAAQLASSTWRLTKTYPTIIPNLYDDHIFIDKQYKKNHGKFIIAYTGRLEKIKGMMHFPDILSRLSSLGVDFQLRLMGRDTFTAPGNNSMKQWLLDSIDRSVHDRVVFLDQVSESVMVEELNNADVGLYISSYETFGYTALEAQACGLPVIASKNGGIGETVVHEKTGFLVDSENCSEIVERLCELHAQPELQKSMGRSASINAKNTYSIHHACQGYLDFYSRIVQMSCRGKYSENN